MAQGVSKAAVVIAFIDQRFQDSENCKLELNFAKQSKVPIVVVKMQDKWRASEWLGIITAGALWTPLHDESTKHQNLKGLIEQVKAAAPTTATAAGAQSPRAAAVVSSTESEAVQALRSELDNLRQDLVRSASQRTAADG